MILILQDTSYREKPATPNSPSGTTVTTMYDHLLSPPSPAEAEEKDGRLRNDLLDEICEDMGIDDNMDLDFDDFCYNGQQKPGPVGSTQRYGQTGSSGNEGRRPSVSNSSSYSTSDSLCAIAKLTYSIANENGTSSSEGDVKARVSPECASSVKQEPCDQGEGDQRVGCNDTDQGKAAAAAAAGKLALQRQMSDGSSSELKRKREREMAGQEMHSEHPMSNSQQQAAPSTQR